MLFATTLEFLPGELPSALTVRGVDLRGFSYILPVENVGKVSSFSWLSWVIVRLPDDTTIRGDLSLSLSIHGVTSNAAVVSISGP